MYSSQSESVRLVALAPALFFLLLLVLPLSRLIHSLTPVALSLSLSAHLCLLLSLWRRGGRTAVVLALELGLAPGEGDVTVTNHVL